MASQKGSSHDDKQKNPDQTIDVVIAGSSVFAPRNEIICGEKRVCLRFGSVSEKYVYKYVFVWQCLTFKWWE